MLSIIIFIIVLGVLIFIHELGHFLIAKKSGIRVDEFAIGFPPNIWSIKHGGTKYSLNAIPFGGYVKIFGEDAEEAALDPNRKDSFLNKSKLTQASVLIGGVLFNILFAWMLFYVTFISGLPTVASDENIENLKDISVSIVSVREGSPAEGVGIEIGDQILSISNGEKSFTGKDVSISKIQETIFTSSGVVDLEIRRNGEIQNLEIVPSSDILENNKAIGIVLERIGTYSVGPIEAIGESFIMMGRTIKLITVGLVTFLAHAITGQADFDQVAGPVGIVGLVGDASNFGLIYLLSFTALISINLAILNILPFPALDGGRLVIVLIESITRKPIKPTIVNAVNAGGFILLIILMIVITISDVVKLF